VPVDSERRGLSPSIWSRSFRPNLEALPSARVVQIDRPVGSRLADPDPIALPVVDVVAACRVLFEAPETVGDLGLRDTARWHRPHALVPNRRLTVLRNDE